MYQVWLLLSVYCDMLSLVLFDDRSRKFFRNCLQSVTSSVKNVELAYVKGRQCLCKFFSSSNFNVLMDHYASGIFAVIELGIGGG